MSTEQLTPEEIIEKKYLLQRLCQNTKWRLRDAMEEYAAVQVEQQTKQLKEERDRAVEIIKRADGILNYSGYDIAYGSPFAQWVKDFLNQLNQKNEG